MSSRTDVPITKDLAVPVTLSPTRPAPLFHDQAGIRPWQKQPNPILPALKCCFALGAYPHLDGSYAIFGIAVESLDVILGIGQVTSNANGVPLTPATIHNLRMLDLAIDSISPCDTSPVYYDGGDQLMFIVEASGVNSPLTFAWYIDGIIQSGAYDFIIETGFGSAREHAVQCIVASDDHSYTITWNVVTTISTPDGA